jgi:hypothetical protein
VEHRPSSRRRRRRRPRRGWLLALLLGIVFVAGVVLGQALENDAPSGGSVTFSRTLRIEPVPETVTVTVTGR